MTYRENVVIYSTSIPKGWWADANYNTDTYDLSLIHISAMNT